MTDPPFPSREPPPILTSHGSSAPTVSSAPSPATFLAPPAPIAPPAASTAANPLNPLLNTLLTGPGGRIVRMAFLFYGVVFLFAIGYAIFGTGVAGRLFGEQMPHPNSLIVGLIVGLTIVAACQITVRTLPSVGGAANELEKILGPLSYPAIAALALVSGFVEELLFRGALWPHLGLVGTTFLFGLVHVVPNRALIGYPLFALGAGFLLGLLRGGSGNVVPCMIAHVTVNALNLGWLEQRRRRTASQAAAPVPQA